MYSVENHYSDDAAEKENENREEHGNWNSRKNAIWLQMIAKKSNWGPRSRLKMKMKAGRMVFPLSNALLHYCIRKIWKRPHFCKIRPWTRSDLGIGCVVAFSILKSSVYRQENHYSNRKVDELDEQKVNFKSLPNKEKS